MAVASRSRYLHNASTDGVVKLLQHAGWEKRPQGATSHVVLTKPGHNIITLSDPISLNQWTSLKHTIGMELKQLVTGGKRHQGKGQALTREAWARRLDFGRQMLQAGFDTRSVVDYGGLGVLTQIGFGIAKLRTMDTEEILRMYIDPYMNKQGRASPKVALRDDTRRNGPVFHRFDPALRTVTSVTVEPTPDPTPVELPSLVQATAIEAPAAPTPTSATDNTDALLSLMGEMNEEFRKLNSRNTEMAFRYAERLRMASAALRDIETAIANARAILSWVPED